MTMPFSSYMPTPLFQEDKSTFYGITYKIDGVDKTQFDNVGGMKKIAEIFAKLEKKWGEQRTNITVANKSTLVKSTIYFSVMMEINPEDDNNIVSTISEYAITHSQAVIAKLLGLHKSEVDIEQFASAKTGINANWINEDSPTGKGRGDDEDVVEEGELFDGIRKELDRLRERLKGHKQEDEILRLMKLLAHEMDNGRGRK